MTVSCADASSPERVFGLDAAPFAECIDDAVFFPSEQHLRALQFMGHVFWTRARLGVVIAPHGCGKTLLINRLLRDLDDRFMAAAITRENITPQEFLLDVLRQYGFALDENDRTDRRRLLERFLHHQASKGRICVLLVENAQNMHPTVLEELRYLANVEVDGAPVLKLLMLGQPALNHVLESPRMAELFNANVTRLTLPPLSEDQTAAYVAHRLHVAGAADADALMPHTLMPRIYAHTLGVPLQINRLCERVLACAAEEGVAGVSDTALDRAIIELRMAQMIPVRGTPAAARVSVVPHAGAGNEVKLVLAMQGQAEREVPLRLDRMLIGRGDEADVRIDSVFISRFHALIVRSDQHDLLVDLGSTNGVLVNSQRVIRRALRHRDLIQIGPARVTYLNPLAVPTTQVDPGETICFARPGFPPMAGEDEDLGTVIAFGQLTLPGKL